MMVKMLNNHMCGAAYCTLDGYDKQYTAVPPTHTSPKVQLVDSCFIM